MSAADNTALGPEAFKRTMAYFGWDKPNPNMKIVDGLAVHGPNYASMSDDDIRKGMNEFSKHTKVGP